MAIKFANQVKAQITQSLLKTLLERAGYRVTRLGIEELFGEIKYLDLPTYLALRLPLNLRSLPDLLVASPAMDAAYLVEVKYRRAFTREALASLYEELKKQREHWPNSYAVIMIGTPFVKDGRFNQDCIRVVMPEATEWLDPNFKLWAGGGMQPPTLEHVWNNLTFLHRAFPQFFNTPETAKDADLITSTIKDLVKLG
jgi:hypothetical protein